MRIVKYEKLKIKKMNKEIFDFLSDLTKNNNKEWFAENKKRYEAAKKSLAEFASELINNINTFDSGIGPLVPAKTIFRIYRDVRFSLNKDPYKTNMGSFIVPEEYKRSWDYPGYYLHLENDASFVSMGVYMPPSPVVKLIRESISENFDTFLSITKKLETTFGALNTDDSLQRVPTGFSKDDPSAEYLKLKSFYVAKNFSNKEVLDKNFLTKITTLFKDSFALKSWLVKALEG